MGALTTIEVKQLGTFELSQDGSSVTLRLAGADRVTLSLDALREILAAVQGLLASAGGGTATQDVRDWKIEDGHEGRILLTFTTADQRQASYVVSESHVHRMAELIMDHEIEAYPLGLRFH